MFSNDFHKFLNIALSVVLFLIFTVVFFIPVWFVGIISLNLGSEGGSSLILFLLIAAIPAYLVVRGLSSRSSANSTSDQTNAKRRRVGTLFLAIVLVLAGLFSGLAIGAIAALGCWKSECSTFQETAWFILPAGSLLFTIPVATKMMRNQKIPEDAPYAPPTTNHEPPATATPSPESVDDETKVDQGN